MLCAWQTRARASARTHRRLELHVHSHSLLSRRRLIVRASSTSTSRAREAPRPALDDDDLDIAVPAVYPLSRIADHATVKAALLIAAVDPFGIESCVVFGKRGTAKSILCRSLRAFMPRVATDCADGSTMFADAPFVEIPVGATDDRILGSIDLDASIASGVARFQPGLLANAHRGVCYVDDICLMDDDKLGVIFAALSEGVVRVEREGLSVSTPCKCLALASFNPEEGELRQHAVDRFNIVCSTDDDDEIFRTSAGRIQAIDAAMEWQDDWRKVMRNCAKEQRELREHLEIARATFLPNVQFKTKDARRLAKLALECGVQGHRAEIAAAKIARASAALRHSLEIGEQDISVAASLAIFPRATRQPPPDALEPPPPPPPPPKRSSTQSQREAEREEDDEQEEQEQEQEQEIGTLEPEIQEPDESTLDTQALMDVFQRAMIRKFSQAKAKGGQAGRTKRQTAYNLQRGRYVKPMFPKAGQIKSGRIAIDATLRAAAPYQKARRLRMMKRSGEAMTTRRVFITKDDVRLKRLSRRSASLTIFVVDASGSMALNRMSVAKAAVFKLLADSYTKRDSVALIEMSNDDAKVVLPPTKSMLLASRRLSVMPCGGGTPLAHGISMAARVAIRAKRVSAASSKIGAVRIVLLTDARPTRSLTWSEIPKSRVDENAPSRKALRDECLDVALRLRALGSSLGINALVIDTDSAFVSDHFAKTLAEHMGATYYALPKLDDRQFAEFMASRA